MLQTDLNALSTNSSTRVPWPSLAPKGRRRLVLWTISVVLLVVASSILVDLAQHQSFIGIIFSASWIAAILVNSAIIDYLLRQHWVK